MTLQLRPGQSLPSCLPRSAWPLELHADAQLHSAGLPWLHGTIGVGAPCCLTLMLRVHNRAGIPIIEGQTELEPGEQRFTLRNLQALGIEAYAHLPEGERIAITQRIWSRRAYGTVRFLTSA